MLPIRYNCPFWEALAVVSWTPSDTTVSYSYIQHIATVAMWILILYQSKINKTATFKEIYHFYAPPRNLYNPTPTKVPIA